MLWIYATFLTVLLLNSAASLDTDSLYLKFYSYNEKYPALLSNQESNNFRAMLNFIRESPEFRPLRLSVIIPQYQSSFIDFLLKYMAENSIGVCTVKATDLALKNNWEDRTNLTWTFFVRDVDNLDIFIYWQQELWKACNQYLIIFTGKGVTVPWRDVFKNLWRKYRVYKAVIVSAQDDFRCLMKFKPFDVRKNDFGAVHKLCLRPSYDRNSERLSLHGNHGRVDVFMNMDEVLLDENAKLFENFHNMNNYPVNVLVFESLLMHVSYDDQNMLKLNKVDADVVFTLEKALKAKFHIQSMRKPDFRREDPFAASLKSIENGGNEMVMTGFFVKPYFMFSKFQFTCSVYEDKLCFVSPDSGLVPKAYMPFKPFEKSLWLLLIIYNIIVTLMWCFVQYTNESMQQRNAARLENNHDVTDAFSVFLRNRSESNRHSIISAGFTRFSNWFTSLFHKKQRPPSMVPHEGPPKIPQPVWLFFNFLEMLCYPLQSARTPAQRALLIGTLFFGMIVNGLYQSVLVSSLSKPFHYPQLRTWEDVVESRKTLITRYANLKSIFVDESPLGRKLYEMIHVVNSTRPTKDMVAYNDKIAITRYYTMVMEDYAYYDNEGNQLLYVVDECPMNYRVSYVLRQYSPYGERVDFILLRLKEAGFVALWFDRVLHPLMIRKMKKKAEIEERKIQLTLDHYSLTFLLLFIGLLGSTMMFFAEVYVASRAKRKRKET